MVASVGVAYHGILQHVVIESQIAPIAKRFFQIERLLTSTNVINGKHPLLGWETKRQFAKKCSRGFKRARELGRHFKSCTGTSDSSVEPSPINDKRLLQCTDCARLFKRPPGIASHRRAFHADAPCKTPEHWTESSSEQCSTTTCKTQQFANATSQQNLHSAGDPMTVLKN